MITDLSNLVLLESNSLSETTGKTITCSTPQRKIRISNDGTANITITLSSGATIVRLATDPETILGPYADFTTFVISTGTYRTSTFGATTSVNTAA
jgi:hypothetical protein